MNNIKNIENNFIYTNIYLLREGVYSDSVSGYANNIKLEFTEGL